MELTDNTRTALVSIIKGNLEKAKPKTDRERREIVADVLKALPPKHTGFFTKMFLPATPRLPKTRIGEVPPKWHPDEYDEVLPSFLRIRHKKNFHLKEPKAKPVQVRVTANLKRRPMNTRTNTDLANLKDRSNMPYMGSKHERLGYIRRVLFHWPHATFRVEELNGAIGPPQGYVVKASFTVMTVFQVGASTGDPVAFYKVWALHDRMSGDCYALWHELTSKPADTDCVVFFEHGKPKRLQMLARF